MIWVLVVTTTLLAGSPIVIPYYTPEECQKAMVRVWDKGSPELKSIECQPFDKFAPDNKIEHPR